MTARVRVVMGCSARRGLHAQPNQRQRSGAVSWWLVVVVDGDGGKATAEAEQAQAIMGWCSGAGW